jgi:hypothetical protein
MRILDGASFGVGLYGLEQCNAYWISLRLVVVAAWLVLKYGCEEFKAGVCLVDSAALADGQCGFELTDVSSDLPWQGRKAVDPAALEDEQHDLELTDVSSGRP